MLDPMVLIIRPQNKQPELGGVFAADGTEEASFEENHGEKSLPQRRGLATDERRLALISG